ncbi:hypothetical protein MTBUT4_260009 [Magnetospirillum sp. UT-4]|nr:hypothetical protein MTBUT4_260009 [Magnetospirillum sp. UT-4]
MGGHDRGQAGPPDRLEGPRLDPRLDRAGGPSQCPLHRPGGPVPDRRSRLGEPGRRAHLGLHLRRPAVQDHAAGVPVVQLGARRLSGRHHGLRGHRRRRRPGRHPPRSLRHAAVLRLQHGRLLQPLALHGPHRQQPAADLPGQLVPQGFERQVHVAGLRREHAGADVDRRSRARPRPGHRKPVRHGPHLRRHPVGRPGLPQGQVPGADEHRPRGRHRRGPQPGGTVRQVPRPPAQGVHLPARTPEVPPVALARHLEPGRRGLTCEGAPEGAPFHLGTIRGGQSALSAA